MATEKRLIDKEPIKKFIEDGLNNPDKRKAFGHDAIEILAEIEYAPTVDAVEVVHGEWIRCLDVDDVEYIECPICGGEFYDGDNDTFDKPYNYCPNCGAKMDGDGNDN